MISSARALAFDVIRATFEDGAFTELAFREAAGERGLAGRERAQAQRLAYGAVQRRGTSDTAIERLAAGPGVAVRFALPAAAPGPRSHHRVLHLPPDAA